VSYGGGVNSTAMILFLIATNIQIDDIVFIDTGAEHPDTLLYVNYFQDYLQRKITIIGKDEGLYDYCFKKKIIPSMKYRWCTDTFKRRPFAKHVRQYKGKKYIYIGFDAGEDSRVTNALSYCKPRSKTRKLFPLFYADITRSKCIQIILDAGLAVPPKSGCYICPFQTKKTLVEMKTMYPILFAQAMALELQHPKKLTIRTGLRLEDVDREHLDLRFDYEPYKPCDCYD
jgi:3'-phosphoadenosine 5'-phosphosulfate sulfotransferase (PAPS reductase)/FAD synthetase